MRDSRKIGRNLLVLGIVLIIFSIPNFIIASQKSNEAEVIRQTNEARANARESSAGFNRTIAYLLLVGGVASLFFGVKVSRRI